MREAPITQLTGIAAAMIEGKPQRKNCGVIPNKVPKTMIVKDESLT